MKDLEGRVAVVAGATRGAGRSIATMLGEGGATAGGGKQSETPRKASGSLDEVCNVPNSGASK